jgi:type VI secretion system secreted protein VgrG
MHKFTQDNRLIAVKTPLDKDDLLLESFSAQESISGLFTIQLELLAENETEIAFERLLGQEATIELSLPQNRKRYFSGIISRFSQGIRDTVFTRYRAELVPKFWLLTRSAQSRIFPGSSSPLTVPDILEKVLKSINPTYDWAGKYEPRNYCVQYRETDYNFASRLMEDEGIFYFFKHGPSGHEMIVTDKSQTHPNVESPSEIVFDTTTSTPLKLDRVHAWTKTQELRADLYRLWDYSFQLPGNDLEAFKETVDSITAGSATHKLKVDANKDCEIYDYPGEYAHRFDGIDKSGGEVPEELKKISTDANGKADNKRTVEIRMEAEAVPSLLVRGASTCGQFLPGHTFTLQRHFNADGDYVLTSVQHTASVGSAYRTGDSSGATYQNSFTCIPASLAFRPQRLSPKPTIQGTQTAVVVGPSGNEIFTDKYGRVKVQFPWDRQGKNDPDSSCWIRVGQIWAGKRWGASFWPRVGQEVIVAFEEGDPDQPVIVGSVYNADQMPPYLGDGPDPRHKKDNKVSGIKSNTTPGGQGYNEIRFDDTKDKEQVFIHAQRSMDVRIGGSYTTTAGGSINLTNGGVDKNGNKYGDCKQLVNKDYHLHVKGDSFILTDGQESHIVGGDAFDWYRGNHRTTVATEEFLEAPTIIHEGGQTISLKAPTIILDGGQKVSIKGPGGYILIDAGGVTISGTMVKINCPGSTPATPAATTGGIGSGAIGDKCKEPQDPAGADSSRTGSRSSK